MKNILFILLAFLSVSFRLHAQNVIKIGIIGLDTSHSTAFTELLNGDSDDEFVKEFEVVAAYPYGSKTIQSSYERIPGCYIDKPVGATLGQAIAIYEMAEKYNVPIFSSSALRYSPQNQKLRKGEFGKILGADCYSPHKVEPTHPDFGFYGIHGVETLYTLMGTGCASVNRMSSKEADVVVGRWKDGRIGTFRGIKEGPSIYGGTAYTSKEAIPAGGYAGYKVLLDQILKFFKTGVAPISKEETIEIFTFMKASNMSKEQNGKIVSMEEAYQEGLKDARKLIKSYK